MLLPRWFPGFAAASRATIVSALLVASARAHTWIVGPGAGADFPDIPSAIVGAQPGDVLVVRPAVYAGGFMLDKGLTIIGYGSVDVTGEGNVLSIPAAQRAAIVNLSLLGMQIDACEGLIVLQNINSTGLVRVNASTDVRAFSITVAPPPFPTTPAVEVSDSRLELVEATLTGSDLQLSCCGDGTGGTGLVCDSGSRIQVSLFHVTGGGGQDNYGQGVYTGSGAPAIATTSTAELLLAGSGMSLVTPGATQANWYYQTCCFDGQQSSLVVMNGGSVWHSGVTWSPSYLHDSVQDCCDIFQLPVRTGPGSFEEVLPSDPSLTLEGEPVSGSPLTFVLRGPIGASARLVFGRRTTIISGASSNEEELVVPSGWITMGSFPASGELRYTIQIPDTIAAGNLQRWAPGTFFAAQAEVTLSASSRTRRSNSVPIVVR